jgi:hypothetical protein
VEQVEPEAQVVEILVRAAQEEPVEQPEDQEQMVLLRH